ncbi:MULTISPECIES: DUF350 domain-containing protein [Bacillales]|jgi:uncharacterized membrane protein YjfL (UPF0719 family)|uniref:DUF350 domain-containing protein n=1 Tax=Bacillales TaxID=1385 RepID=UPI0006A78576|nr:MULTISPECIES: DUF350 domain-containing protein [Bacillales]OBZ10313.1 DUF350 domain-containing protein [Bacillus sp. FJAT-26390]
MSWIDLIRIPIWTGAGAILLVIIMFLDSRFTKYNDLQEIKNGNTAVTTRFVLKLFAQAYILSQSISKSSEMWEALVISLVSFVLLLVLEWIVEKVVIAISGMKLEQGIHEGKVGYALFAGSLHVAGALIIGSI